MYYSCVDLFTKQFGEIEITSFTHELYMCIMHMTVYVYHAYVFIVCIMGRWSKHEII